VNGTDQTARRREIEAAAYELLAEKGYKATSMLAIAKKASASNETMYRWYGNKQTLFRALVEENARLVREQLEASIAGGGSLDDILRKIGPLLLDLVTGERAVALNRAAVVDVHDSGTLGQIIASAGRDTVLPLLEKAFRTASSRRRLSASEARRFAQAYANLLIGDLQIRRVIGAIEAPTRRDIVQRSERARRLTLELIEQ
jgi:AcrR family transcriptional regulator